MSSSSLAAYVAVHKSLFNNSLDLGIELNWKQQEHYDEPAVTLHIFF